MWLDNLKEFTARSGLTNKQIAELAMLSEKTVDRTLDGKIKTPYADTLYRWCKVIGASLDDILADTKVVVGNANLIALQTDIDKLNEEIAQLKEKNTSLAGEIERQKTMLEHKNEIIAHKDEIIAHKDKIISVYDYYNKLKN